jgi:glycosyltransferase involved in cell wall biosynthesis
MKILLVDQFSGAAGGQQCLIDLVPGLTERGWSVHAAIPSGDTLGKRLSELGVSVREFPPLDYSNARKTARDVLRFPAGTLHLARMIRQENADIVYANGPRILPAAALAAENLVFHAHSLVPQPSARELVGLSLRSRNAAVIAACDYVAKPLPRRNLRVVYSGVSDYSGVGLARTNTRPTVGIVGRISKEKGHLDFLQAAKIVLREFGECDFVICGAPLHSGADYLAEVERLAKGLPVTFLGWREDVGAVLAGLSVLAVPSSGIDAAPRVIMEAFSAGVPVVAYPSGGIVELIDHAQTGLLTSAANPEALAASLLAVLGNPAKRESLSEHARAAYLKRFTLNRYRQQILEVLVGQAASLRRLVKPPR